MRTASVLSATFAADSNEIVSALTSWARRSTGPHPLLSSSRDVGRVEALSASIARALRDQAADFGLVSPLPTSAAVVPIVLGAAADLSWDDAERAHAAAFEIGARMALVLATRGDLGAPTWPERAASATATACVLGLDAARTASAIALSLRRDDLSTDAPMHPDASVFALTNAVVDGALSAELAFEGVSSTARGYAARSPWLDDASIAVARLGELWLADSLHVREHHAAAGFQAAIDAAIEVGAQARAVLRRVLHAKDVRAIRVEVSAWGLPLDAATRAPLAELLAATVLTHAPRTIAADRSHTSRDDVTSIAERVSITHAWDLTHRVAFQVGRALDRAGLLRVEEAQFLRRTRQLLGSPAVLDDGVPFGQRATGALRSLVRWSGRRDSTSAPSPGTLEGVTVPFGARLRLELEGGAHFEADREGGRGAPARPIAEALSIARTKLIDAASPSIGARRAGKLATMILEPSKRQRVRDVVDALLPT